MVGNGLTVIVNVLVVPTQLTPPLVKVGVIVIFAVIGADVSLVATKLGIPVTLPTLAAAKPIAVLLFVQVYVVVPPVLAVSKVTAVVLAL